ncbi:alpha-galactosidase [Pilaira anomala]|nr:alpha-galactosidase [Pilaira anomala]
MIFHTLLFAIFVYGCTALSVLKTGITPHKHEKMWFLTTERTSYVIGVMPNSKEVLNLHWGPRIISMNDIEPLTKYPTERSSQDPPITAAHEEFPAFGGLRYGPDVLRTTFENGTRELDLIFESARIVKKNKLTLTLRDREHTGFKVEMYYELDVANDIILRSGKIKATTDETYEILKAQSAAFHIMPPAGNMKRDLISLAGAWSAETQVQRHSVQPGSSHILQSVRGIPSAQAYPYFAIKDSTSDGEHADNDVYFGTIGWSGNWKIEVHTNIEGKVTVTGGMHERDFGYEVKKGRDLELPPFAVGYTSNGLGGARKSLTNHIRDNKDTDLVADPKGVQPVLYNGWEAYDMNVNITNQKRMAKMASEFGADMFVLDDGWFIGRHKDNAGLGDWFVDENKFPEGLKPLADYVHSLNMTFGLWFEPEMVNPNSNLYREHPDWVYHYDERPRYLERDQLVLDITRQDVKEYVMGRVLNITKEVGVDFIKWDMNRPMATVGSAFGKEVWVEHVKAFHEMVGMVKKAGITFETCSSGGGRSDMSILKKSESSWPSDNTRPDARLMIQYGNSLVVPPDMMSSWVTDSPGNDNRTVYPISYRFHVSFMGALGIGSDLNHLSEAELKEYKGWVKIYHDIRHVMQRGNLNWLVAPPHANKETSARETYTAVTQTTNDKQDESVVLAFRQYSAFFFPLPPVKLRDLNKNKEYKVTIWSSSPDKPVFTGKMSGGALMGKGLKLPYLDVPAYGSVVVHLKQV